MPFCTARAKSGSVIWPDKPERHVDAGGNPGRGHDPAVAHEPHVVEHGGGPAQLAQLRHGAPMRRDPLADRELRGEQDPGAGADAGDPLAAGGLARDIVDKHGILGLDLAAAAAGNQDDVERRRGRETVARRDAEALGAADRGVALGMVQTVNRSSRIPAA